MTNILSNLAHRFGEGARNYQDPSRRDRLIKEEELKQALEQKQANDLAIRRVLSQQSIPAYARAGGSMERTPEQIKQQQLAQLAEINSPESMALLAQQSPLTAKRATPVSPSGKLQADVDAGFITPELAEQLNRKAVEPSRPLVNIGGSEVEKTRVIKSEERRSDIINNVFADADSARNKAFEASNIEENLDSLVASGGSTGPASGLLDFMQNVGVQAGLDLDLSASSSRTAIEAASNKLAVPLTKQLGVNPTDKDFSIIKSTVARAGTSIPANYALVDLIKQSSKRDIAREAVIMNAQERGLNETQIRKALENFRKNNRLKIPVPLPNDIAKMKIGKRYTTDKGVYQFDGENMVRVR